VKKEEERKKKRKRSPLPEEESKVWLLPSREGEKGKDPC